LIRYALQYADPACIALHGKKTMHNLHTLDRARVNPQRIDHRVDSKEPSCVE